jgi:hypothetical protein
MVLFRVLVENPALLQYPGRTLEALMRKHTFSTAEDLVSIRVPKKLAGKKLVLVDAAEYAALKRRLAEVSDALEKISRGDAAYRQGRTKTVSSLAELGR